MGDGTLSSASPVDRWFSEKLGAPGSRGKLFVRYGFDQSRRADLVAAGYWSPFIGGPY